MMDDIILKKRGMKQWINLKQKFSTVSVNVRKHQVKDALLLLTINWALQFSKAPWYRAIYATACRMTNVIEDTTIGDSGLRMQV